MKALKCDFCSGTLIMDKSREFATCEYCGTKYMKETIREKIQEIRGEVKISGAVETFTGSTEKERLVKNAETYIGIKEFKKALDTYIKITQQFPDDYRGWWGIFTTPIEQYFCNGRFTDVKGSHLSNAFSLCPDKNILTEYYKSVINRYGKLLRVIPCKNKVSLALVNNLEPPVALDNFSSWLIFNQTGNARFYPNFFMGFISNLSNMYVDGIKSGSIYTELNRCIPPFAKENAFINFSGYNLTALVGFVSKLNGARHSEAAININQPSKMFHKIGWGNNYVDITGIQGACGRWLFTLNKEGHPVSVLMKKAVTMPDVYRFYNRCQHCGGKFKGIIKSVCTQCGKPKDY